MNKNDITKMPYAVWLENAIRDMTDLNVCGITLAAIDENGDTYINYYNITMADKLVISGLVQQDAMMDTLAANGLVKYDDETEEVIVDDEEDEYGEEE